METFTIPDNNRILIIDDTESIHTDFENILAAPEANSTEMSTLEAKLFGIDQQEEQLKSFELSHAYQGLDGVNMVQQAIDQHQPFALAFVDARMPPGIDGIETIFKLWEIDPEINIVLCSAYTDHTWSSIVERFGDTDKLLVLKKPFEIIEVQQMTNALCKKWNLQIQARRSANDLKLIVEEKTKTLLQQKKHLQVSLQALKDTKLQLFQADRLASVGQLAAGVAHEINNPIAFIQSNVQFIKKNLLQSTPQKENTLSCQLHAEIPEVIEDIEDGLDRVSKIVRDLLDFSRDKHDDKELVDIAQVIEKSISIAQTQIGCFSQTKDISINTMLNSHGYLHGNPGQLGQVILNLIINAAQAIPTTGEIIIETSNAQNQLLIKIKDSGTGMNQEVLQKIFNPFFTTKAVGQGTGLGLHIVQNIIQQHQGEIEVDSVEGQGSEFTLKFPLINS